MHWSVCLVFDFRWLLWLRWWLSRMTSWAPFPYPLHYPYSSLFTLPSPSPKEKKVSNFYSSNSSFCPQKCWNIYNISFKTSVLLSTYRCPHILIPWFQIQVRLLLPVNVNFVCSSNVDGLIFDFRCFLWLCISRLLPLHPSNPIAPEGVSV